MIRRILEAIDEKELHPASGLEPAPGKMDVLAAVRQAVLEVLGPYIAAHVGAYPDAASDEWDEDRVRQIIEKSTYTGADDPGQWAPKAYVVVHHESGVPEAFDEGFGVDYFGKWVQVGDRASELSGVKMFNESINSAVSAMWPA